MAVYLVLAGLPVLLTAGYGLFMAPGSRVFGRYPHRGATADRVVALTFDDGPNEPYTSQIADALEARGIRATFFQVGRCIQRHPEVTLRLREAGHVIGNHSFAHAFHAYFVPRRFRREVTRTQAVLTELLGSTPALARTPWLWRTPAILATLRRSSLQPVAGVFAHPAEVLQIDAARIARGAVAKVRPGSILIFHDGFDGRGGYRAQTVRAVELTADALLAQGYRFVTVDELLGVDAYRDLRPPSEAIA
jgi:peptidoglycan/xylan/chitin deacetylase (PgdA/CDA1 family)